MDKKVKDFNEALHELREQLKPYFAEFEEKCALDKKNQIEMLVKKLELNDMDINKTWPNPRYGVDILEYHYAISFIDFKDKNYWNAPSPVKLNEEKIQKIIKCSKFMARESLDAYVTKLQEKIGEKVSSALIRGDLWEHSVLEVKTVSGKEIMFRTQKIVNSSKYGKAFYQFPTRRVSR
ncbi:MAG: hypothetical protein CVU15_01485 [Betaproteobacteria bacterium HGW-Betaproteobacteria-1]|nr:MAG: hypothetical protein CVU15_01485 [Betaproteobacteria bacterium HGW-Betaproteobacteria-1]